MKIDLNNMTDVCTGPMNLDTIGKELIRCIVHKSPTRLVVDIKEISPGKYQTKLYIPIRDFKKKVEYKNGLEKQKLGDEHFR